MNPTLLVAVDSIRALLHRRLLVALMLALLGLTAVFSVTVTKVKKSILEASELAAGMKDGELSEAEQEQARQGIDQAGSFFLAGFYWFSAFGGTVVALFICCTAVASDLRRGTIHMILAKPVTRSQFLLGKYCGAIAVLFGYSLLAGIALVIFTQVNDLELNLAAQYAPWLMFCQSLMVGSVAMLLSLLLHPILAAVVAFFASAGFFSSPNPLYFVLPSYDQFNVFGLIMNGRLIALEDILTLTIYAFDVAAIFLLLALWRFRSRELI